MYQHQTNRPNRSFQQGNQNRRRVPKSFDPSLFVRKPEPVAPEVAYVATHAFSDFAFRKDLHEAIARHGYGTPTPIQDQAIPHILAGKDVVGIANTGTGKTAAFLLPLMQRLLEDPTHRGLIIVPTRELAVQVADEFRAFARQLPLHCVVCIGGIDIRPQIQGLRRNPRIVIGTPGRLKDLSQQRELQFSVFRTLVLDEVDRMLDMGFINDVRHILERLPRERHSLFFSATMPPGVSMVMKEFLHDPVTVTIQSRNTAALVHQDIVKIGGRSKVDVLHELLQTEGFDKVLVFGRTKHGLDKLARSLTQRGVATVAIHGNKSQSQRQRALREFKENRVRVLLATDVASRGLDIDAVTHVINYDQPESYEDYVHRIGRTGRANKTGIALTFV